MEIDQEKQDCESSAIRLNHEWVQVLINLRMKYARSFTGKRHSATNAWDEILKEMQELGAPKSVTRFKIKKKWMNLIARYKQLKSDSDAKKQNTWPYFEQIDRAYSKNRNGSKQICDNLNQFRFSPLDGSNKYSEKEKFIRTLIEFRYQYRHLFTGKKYAAQKGWMVIQNYLPSGEKYSTDQIRKVWHNLIQRYKTLIENVPDHTKITWIYFQQLHKIMSPNETSSNIEFVDEVSASGSNIEVQPNEEHNPFENINADVVPFLSDIDQIKNDNNGKQLTEENESEAALPSVNIVDEPIVFSVENKYKSDTSVDDLLGYLKERDQKRDEQFKELLGVMQDILLHLKKQ